MTKYRLDYTLFENAYQKGPKDSMRIQLSDHFTYKKLLRFVFPSIIMMIFTSIYSVVDGLFVSNFVGKTPFAAVNLIMPILIILGSLGFMIGTGGTAIVGKTLGEGEPQKANAYFSMLLYVVFIIGAAFALIGCIFLRPLSRLLGAEGVFLENCVLYGRIILVALPFFMLQNMFQSFFVTAEKPKLGLLVTVFSGCLNIVLDALLVAVFRWGLAGAALATAASQIAGTFVAVAYFGRKNDSLLQLTKTRFYGKVLWKACVNGSSEMVSNIASSVVTMLYNFQLMRYAGENGVAAFGVVMYVSFLFAAIFYGYAVGSAPIISYHFGAGSHAELQNIFGKSMRIIGITGVAMFLLIKITATPLSTIFVGYDKELLGITVHAFQIFAISFLLSGFSAFASAFFTALNDGVISAAIAFLRTLLFETASILLLPSLFGLNGVWWAIVVAEAASFIIAAFFLWIKRKKYRYLS